MPFSVLACHLSRTLRWAVCSFLSFVQNFRAHHAAASSHFGPVAAWCRGLPWARRRTDTSHVSFLHNICPSFFSCSVFFWVVCLSWRALIPLFLSLFSYVLKLLLGVIDPNYLDWWLKPLKTYFCPYCWCLNMLFFGCSNMLRSVFRFHNYSSKNPSLCIIIIRIVRTKWLQPGLSLALYMA